MRPGPQKQKPCRFDHERNRDRDADGGPAGDESGDRAAGDARTNCHERAGSDQ
jgi:hypothetical protein